ncbi:MAG: hypothetical protein EBX35_08790 [Planctomycetia bacterium]|nr:hypothetical protein [Planctomycetia bacterium]
MLCTPSRISAAASMPKSTIGAVTPLITTSTVLQTSQCFHCVNLAARSPAINAASYIAHMPAARCCQRTCRIESTWTIIAVTAKNTTPMAIRPRPPPPTSSQHPVSITAQTCGSRKAITFQVSSN